MSGELENESREGVLARVDKRFQVEFAPLDHDGTRYQVLDVANMTQYLDGLVARGGVRDPLKDLPVWAKVWPGTFVLETCLRKRLVCEGKRLLELGCGTGLLSLLCARLGFSSVTASDVEEGALLFARANVLKNGLKDRIAVEKVDVTAPGKNPRLPEPFDIVAASELLYLDELHSPLLNFLSRHLAEDGKAVFCTDMARRKPHFAKKAAKKFKVSELFLPGSWTDEEGESHRRLYSLLILESLPHAR